MLQVRMEARPINTSAMHSLAPMQFIGMGNLVFCGQWEAMR